MQNENEQNAAAIEQDIKRTQDSISETIDELSEKLNPSRIVSDFFESGDGKGSQFIKAAKDNPLAVGLIGAGLLLLVSERSGLIERFTSKIKSGSGGYDPYGDVGGDPYHHDYVSHMGNVQRLDQEDDSAYQRRRDTARSDFLMVERGHDEDEHSFRERLDTAGNKLRERTQALRDNVSDYGSAAHDKLSNASDATREHLRKTSGQAKDLYRKNPAISGLVAAALGAGIGAALPMSRMENEHLGKTGDTLRHETAAIKDDVVSAARQ